MIGPQLQASIGHLNQTGIALVVGLIGMFIGALGVANSLQNALNSVWEIPFHPPPRVPVVVAAQCRPDHRGRPGLHRHHGPVRARGRGAQSFPACLPVLAFAVSLVLNFGLFWLAFRLGTASEITWRQLWLGAAISAVIWQVLQSFGTNFVSHQLAHASPLYGTFALVLGLIAWLYLQAQLTLYAIEINVVRAYRLWPRSLAPPPYTEQDRHAFRLYVEKRGDQRDIVVGAGGEDDREKTSG